MLMKRYCPLPVGRNQKKVELRNKKTLNFTPKFELMRKKAFTASERSGIVSEQTTGKSVDEICRTHQISPATFYKWKNQKETESDENRRRLDQLDKENKRLKKMYSELSIDHEILKEGYEILKKIQAQSNKKR
jgi:putative transposase